MVAEEEEEAPAATGSTAEPSASALAAAAAAAAAGKTLPNVTPLGEGDVAGGGGDGGVGADVQAEGVDHGGDPADVVVVVKRRKKSKKEKTKEQEEGSKKHKRPKEPPPPPSEGQGRPTFEGSRPSLYLCTCRLRTQLSLSVRPSGKTVFVACRVCLSPPSAQVLFLVAKLSVMSRSAGSAAAENPFPMAKTLPSPFKAISSPSSLQHVLCRFTPSPFS